MTAQLLVWSANCIINSDAQSCQSLDQLGGVSDAQRHYLAFLASRRDTLIVPAANCLGYVLRKRADAGVDPNRDFSYSRSDNRCFISATAKLFFALMTTNMIQIVVTYHGGMVALGYEWGSRNHMRPKDASPDDRANLDLAKLMSRYAGSFKREKAYPSKSSSPLLYS